MPLEDMVKSPAESTMQIKQSHELFQQTTTTYMESMATQMSQLTDVINKLDTQYWKLPSQPMSNVHIINAISTVSCMESSPTPAPKLVIELVKAIDYEKNMTSPRRRRIRFDPPFNLNAKIPHVAFPSK